MLRVTSHNTLLHLELAGLKSGHIYGASHLSELVMRLGAMGAVRSQLVFGTRGKVSEQAHIWRWVELFEASLFSELVLELGNFRSFPKK